VPRKPPKLQKPRRKRTPPIRRIFLLSPANAGGIRAKLMLRKEATFPLALRLRDGRLTLGEAFSFISGLYFRGKLAYATAFAQPPADTGESS